MSIRYLCGGKPIDEEVVRALSNSDLYIPTSLDDLMKQIKFTIQLLDLITGRDSIASGGYTEALRQLEFVV